MFRDRSFEFFLERVTKATDPDARGRLVDEYLRALTYPVFEDETTVVLLHRARTNAVRIVGDMTDWLDSISFVRIPETDLYWFRGTYEPEARLEYVFYTSDAGAPVTDPLNQYAVNGFVLNSELAMPRYCRHPVFDAYRDGRKGGFALLRDYTIPAGALPYPHTVHVCTPPGYDGGQDRYPCVYFQDGRDYIEYGVAPSVLRTLIESGTIPPVIGIFVTPPNLHLPQTPNRTTEYGMNPDYVTFVAQELRMWVDANFRTVCDPAARLVIGDSYGGLISATIGLRRPDVFEMAYSQSGYMSFGNDQLLRELAETEGISGRFYLDCGTYERRVGRGIVPDSEGDFLAANRKMAEYMRGRGVDLVYREYPEGHTWGNWRAHLHDALEHFFGKR
jgi:enterochelin esterase family protein